MALGPINESNARLYQWATQNAGRLNPTGMLAPFAVASVDAWVLCDGRILLRKSYPDLFSVIGTAYNTGGETAFQFRVPNITLGGLAWHIKS